MMICFSSLSKPLNFFSSVQTWLLQHATYLLKVFLQKEGFSCTV
ncbi:unnamed protein product [Amoebophrya sp. A120]|nr:unnamed protein product [Amoebophrya sp. A120]|eukprot:GSA120T00026411001.1